MPREIVGLFNRAARGDTGYVKFRRDLNDAVEIAADVYQPMTSLVNRIRILEERPGVNLSDEDRQLSEMMMSIQRQLFFFQARVRKIMRRAKEGEI